MGDLFDEFKRELERRRAEAEGRAAQGGGHDGDDGDDDSSRDGDDGDSQREWRPDEKRESKVVFIGRDLRAEHIRKGFLACAA